MFRLLMLAATVSLIGGCALVIPESYTSPKEVTLEQAMKDVACALKTRQNEFQRLRLRTGDILDTTEITLALKASATGESTLVVDASKAAPAIIPLGLTYTDKSTLVGSRDNTIKFTFKNIYTATLNKAGEAKVRKQGPDLNFNVSDRLPVQQPCKSIAFVVPN